MEVGSDISKKIQAAIKSKLIEINAYVDDELPDYIMIMIANRKPEDQMAEALSLFLGTHTNAFTKWLFELLSTLRNKKVEIKKPSFELKEISVAVKKTKPSMGTSDGDSRSLENIESDNLSTKCDVQDDVNKTSRWDSQKKVNKSNSKTDDFGKYDMLGKDNTSKEAVIDIVPETNDLFDKEFLAGNDDLENSEKKVSKVSGSSASKPQSTISQKETSLSLNNSRINNEKSKLKTPHEKTIKKRSATEKAVEKKTKRRSSDEYHTKSEQKASSSSKRIISVKKNLQVNRKVSTSDKEFASQFAPPKLKSKKQKLTKENKLSKHKSNSNVRDWDKGKENDSLSYDTDEEVHFHKKRSKQSLDFTMTDSDDESCVTHKTRSTVAVASKVATVKNPQYDSDEEDEDEVSSGAVISKIAIPQRRPRLPPAKQANRSLLLKAVSEAESSVRNRGTGKRIERTVPVVFSKSTSKKEAELAQRKCQADKDEIYFGCEEPNSAGIKKDAQNQIPLKRKKLVRVQNSTDTLTQNIDGNESYVSIKKSRKSDSDKSAAKTSSTIVQGEGPDSRLIVSNESDGKTETKKPKKILIRKSSLLNSSTTEHFDTRKLTIKNKPKIKADKEIVKSANGKQKESVPDPCFIVTLDGTAQHLKGTSKNKNMFIKESSSFRATPVEAPAINQVNVSLSSSQQQSHEATHSISANSSVEEMGGLLMSDIELNKMRQKLLLMQKEAEKLKEIQIKQHEIIKHKITVNSNGSSDLAGSERRSIHVANVHFSATEKQLVEHFSICGKVLRTTILKDQYTGRPKGFAYLEFEEPGCVEMALALDGTSFCGRNIKITKKDDEALKSQSFSQPMRYGGRSQRFPSTRGFRRYPNRYGPVTYARPRVRPAVARNRSWVKPGYSPS
ncbi:unnamed protein product [Clavelina lepadiformis]|uniref:Zinc finger CCCH domain-containing protein 14 n=1 Tax=Clavelina lepadiformis TaxID=159417 RepID=A0ABP0FBU3_CLALP